MMKKTMVIVLAMLLVLIVGQSAFAKGNVGLTLNYDHKAYNFMSEEEEEILKINLIENGFNVGLFGEYYIFNSFALAGELNVSFFSGNMIDSTESLTGEIEESDPELYKYTQLDFNLFGKYDVFNFNSANIGIQAGLMESFAKWDDGTTANIFMIGLGTYANLKATDKFNIYADAKFPIAFFMNYAENYDDKDGFFKLFLYDVDLGFTYAITKNINLGLNFNMSSANLDGISSGIERKMGYDSKAFCFSIGAKVGYSF